MWVAIEFPLFNRGKVPIKGYLIVKHTCFWAIFGFQFFFAVTLIWLLLKSFCEWRVTLCWFWLEPLAYFPFYYICCRFTSVPALALAPAPGSVSGSNCPRTNIPGGRQLLEPGLRLRLYYVAIVAGGSGKLSPSNLLAWQIRFWCPRQESKKNQHAKCTLNTSIFGVGVEKSHKWKKRKRKKKSKSLVKQTGGDQKDVSDAGAALSLIYSEYNCSFHTLYNAFPASVLTCTLEKCIHINGTSWPGWLTDCCGAQTVRPTRLTFSHNLAENFKRQQV